MQKAIIVHEGQEELLTDTSEAALLAADIIFTEETLGETTFYQIRSGKSWMDVDAVIRPAQSA